MRSSHEKCHCLPVTELSKKQETDEEDTRQGLWQMVLQGHNQNVFIKGEYLIIGNLFASPICIHKEI